MDLLIDHPSMQVSSKEVAALIPDESANSKIGLADTQRQASWGLARISHRQKLDFGTFNRYEFDSTAGNGTNVYVLDSGIYTDHAEFEARASWGTTIASGSGSVDTIGHGTHCAGTIASKKYGVAKKSNLIAVKVLDDNLAGVTSDFIGGLEWAVTDQQQRSAASIIFFNPGIAGLSSLETRLEDNPSDLTAAINAAIDAGIQVVVSYLSVFIIPLSILSRGPETSPVS